MRVLCINPTLEGRMGFKEATSRLNGLESIHIMESLYDAQEQLYAGTLFHALYLSNHFQEEVLKEFLVNAQSSKGGADSAYMLTVSRYDSEETDPRFVTEFGFDGFLKEPVQSAVLAGSLEKARQIFKTRENARQKAAVDILISGIIKNIDIAALKMMSHESIGAEKKNLSIISRTLKSLPPDLQDLYLQKFIERVENSVAARAPERNELHSKPNPKIIRITR